MSEETPKDYQSLLAEATKLRKVDAQRPKKDARGRKPVMTPAVITKILDLIRGGCSRIVAAQAAGISARSLANYMEKPGPAHRAFCEALYQAEADASAAVEKSLAGVILDGDVKAMMFHLERSPLTRHIYSRKDPRIVELEIKAYEYEIEKKKAEIEYLKAKANEQGPQEAPRVEITFPIYDPEAIRMAEVQAALPAPDTDEGDGNE